MPPPPSFSSLPSRFGRFGQPRPILDMEDYDVRSAASILASVKEQEARFEQLTRALEEERRNVNLQLERANLPPNAPNSQPIPWQQVVMQVNDASMLTYPNSHYQPPSLCFLLSPLTWASSSHCHVCSWSLLFITDGIIDLPVCSVCDLRQMSLFCVNPLSWMLCNNLPCGDSSLRTS